MKIVTPEGMRDHIKKTVMSGPSPPPPPVMLRTYGSRHWPPHFNGRCYGPASD